MSAAETVRRWSPTSVGINLAILAFNATLIGAVWIAVLEIERVDHRETLNAAIDRNDNLVIALEQYTIRTIESAEAVIEHLVHEYARGGGKIDIERFVKDHTISGTAFTSIVLADEYGNVATTAHAEKTARPANVADREYFSAHVTQDTGKVFVGKPVISGITGKSVVPVTQRINRPDGRFGGVVIVSIDHSRFTDVLQDARMRPLDIISLVGLDGITRARLRGTTPTAGEDISKSPLFALQAKQPVGNYVSRGQIDGVKRIFSYRTIPEYQLIATVGTAEADALSRFSRRQQQYFWAAGLSSALITAFTLMLMLMLARQRQAASTIARDQARFLATFNQAAVGIAHSDLEGRCLEVNQKLCDITGYPRNELLGRKFTDITHPDDVAASIQFRRQVVAESKTFNSLQQEKRYIRKDGSIVWCLLTTSVVRDDAGHIAYLAAIIQDISERKKGEQSLRVLEQEQRQLAQQAEAERARLAEAQAVANMGSWETRFPDLAVTWSAQTHRIFETDAAHYQPTHPGFMEFVHPEDRAKVDAAFTASLADRLPRTLEHRIVTRDGRIKIVEERWRVFFDDQGQPDHAVGNCQDITNQKKAEQTRTQLAAIVESSIDAIISSTPETKKILSWNRAAERMFGWSADEVISRSVRIITPPEYIGRLDPLIRRTMQGETVAPVETWRQRKDGSRFEAQVSFSAVRDQDGKLTAIATIIRDITERRRAEAELRALSSRLSEVEETERRNIHRELHDQVGASLSALKLDLSLISNMLDGDTHKIIGDRLRNAQQLTGDTVARIRNVMADLRPPALDDFGLLAALRTHAQSQATRLGIPITVEGEEILPRLSIVVETALFRIVQEALTNIAKHAQASRAVITLAATDDRVTLVVMDNGVGFDPGRSSPQRTGWGLRTMRERAQAIAADLRIESTPGKGTSIFIELGRETL